MKTNTIKEIIQEISESGIEKEVITTLSKLQIHLLRLMSTEFLLYHVIMNISKLNEGQQVL